MYNKSSCRSDKRGKDRWRVELLAVRRRNGNRFIDQSAGKFPQVRIGRDCADGRVDQCRQRVDGHVQKQLFPKQMFYAVNDIRLKSATVKEGSHLFRRRAVACRETDVRNARSRMVNDPRIARNAVVLGCAEQNVLGRGIIPHDLLVAHAVLQGEQERFRADQRAVCFQSRTAVQILDKQNYQSIRFVAAVAR